MEDPQRRLSADDMRRLAAKFARLRQALDSDRASFSDRIVLGWMHEALENQSIPCRRIARIHQVLRKMGIE